jgi:hypothetical protein
MIRNFHFILFRILTFFNKNMCLSRSSDFFKLLLKHPFTMGVRTQLIVVSGLSVGIPLSLGFRPQLIVVSDLSLGIPLTVGFRPQLVVVSGLSVGIPLTVGFRGCLGWLQL